ncbi:hypothetical protein V2A60_001712 [Cordyceps javanica]
MRAEGNTKSSRSFSHAFLGDGDDEQQPALQFKKRKAAQHGTVSVAGTRSKRFAPVRGGRPWTVSVAVPGSILSNLPTAEQRIATVARLARSLAIFCVDEVIVYNDEAPTSAAAAAAGGVGNNLTRFDGAPSGTYTGDSDPCHFVAQLLSFLECPPFMRRRLFPLHPNLRHTALLPAVDMPHHPHPKAPWVPYVEGVTVEPAGEGLVEGAAAAGGGGSLVDTGPGGLVRVADTIPPHTRVTLRLGGPDAAGDPVCAHPDAPRAEGGYYWGYAVRRCASLSAVFTECPHGGGYDLSVGTSERGAPLSQVMAEHRRRQQDQQRQQQDRRQQQEQESRWRRGHRHYRAPDHGHHGHENEEDRETAGGPSLAAPSFRHLLVVFGGPRGIELAAAHDPKLAAINIRGARTRELFDHWVDVLPGQGSRAIATDEAVPIALMGLRGLWESV